MSILRLMIGTLFFFWFVSPLLEFYIQHVLEYTFISVLLAKNHTFEGPLLSAGWAWLEQKSQATCGCARLGCT